MALKKDEAKDPRSCWNRAEENEPVFVLLGRDKSAAVCIRAWIFHRLSTGKSAENSPEIIEARAWAVKMERFAEAKGKETL